MADRPHRGRGGSRGGGGGRGGGAPGRGGGAGAAAAAPGGAGGAAGQERPKKENILDLKKYMDKRITVKFNGGREGLCCAFLTPFLLPSPATPIFLSLLLPFPALGYICPGEKRKRRENG